LVPDLLDLGMMLGDAVGGVAIFPGEDPGSFWLKEPEVKARKFEDVVK
jgi:hypothetical protein